MEVFRMMKKQKKIETKYIKYTRTFEDIPEKLNRKRKHYTIKAQYKFNLYNVSEVLKNKIKKMEK